MVKTKYAVSGSHRSPTELPVPSSLLYPPTSPVSLSIDREFWEEVLPACFPAHGWAVLHVDVLRMARLSPVEYADI